MVSEILFRASFKFGFLCIVAMLSFSASGREYDGIMRDKAALLSFIANIVPDQQITLEHWGSTSVHVCNWSGVQCNNARDQIVQLDLSGRSLKGIISPALANLSSLKVLDLSSNLFHGNIPSGIGYLVRLEQLSLSWNHLEGSIPAELSHLSQLVYLDLGSNRLTGNVPTPLFCNGSSLEYIDLSNNSLSGEISLKNECELRELRYLLMWSNSFVGKIPPALSNSSKLEWLDLESNMLCGELPSRIISTMSKLQYLYLSYNDFVSHDANTNIQPFFAALANSSNFQELELAGNNLRGEMPSNIASLSTNIVQIHLDDNFINGPIPPDISNLVNLSLMNLSSNLLNGAVPPQLCNMKKLERIYLSDNSLSGDIPPALGNISHLGLLDLSKNKLSGSIPDSFAYLSQLRRLLLYENQLSGTIPPSLGQCVNLEILDLSHNNISGRIPREVVGLRSLKLYLNLSSNHLEGPIPLEFSKMDMILAIDLSSNHLSGTIPPQLGSCIALEYLNLSGNLFEGPLPLSVGQLPYLQNFDASFNHLGGEIPESFQTSSTLTAMNFSFNNFSGNIQNEGAFSKLAIESFLGNYGLCGSIKGMSSCKRKITLRLLILPIILALFSTAVLCSFGLLRSRLKRNLVVFNRGDLEDKYSGRKDINHPRISYQQLIQATGGFDASNIIGSGHFGHVYKGTLQDNTRIAVKVLDTMAAREFSGSFKRECQILKRIRHRNLIKILTICSKPDFKAIVLPLMSNGSLERHLYPCHGLSNRLDLIQLVNICSDVAEGVAYLHHHSPIRIVHCDIKPNNILLDDDMTALVTDFGIARLVKDGDGKILAIDSTSFSSTDGLLCGSLGYIAPEYGMGGRASTQGDVYSYGVLLLEMVTGMHPTEVLYHQGSSMHEWVKSHYPDRLEPIVEPALVRCAPENTPKYYNKIWRDIIIELIELGLLCTQKTPSMRPSMLDVAQDVGRLKQYLSDPSSLLIEDCSHKVDAQV